MLEKAIDFLLENACVNIRYLINRDFLNISINEPSMQNMQDEILNQKNIQKIFTSQQKDGWFGHELHGGDGMDSVITYLLMRGVETENEHLQRAKNALLYPEISSKHKNYFRGGDALDAGGRGGNKAVMAGILTGMGEPENNPLLAEEINLSLRHFKGALNYSSVDDFTIVSTGKKKTRYYKPNALFPGANHIGLLVHTFGWRTEENIRMLKKSMSHCFELMKEGYEITFKKMPPYGNGFVGPFNFNWQAFDIRNFKGFSDDSYRCGYVFWIRTLNGFAGYVKAGIVDGIPKIKDQYLFLADLLEKDRLYGELSENAKTGFRQIGAIEPSWRNEINKKCDIYFNAYKALYHAGLCTK